MLIWRLPLPPRARRVPLPNKEEKEEGRGIAGGGGGSKQSAGTDRGFVGRFLIRCENVRSEKNDNVFSCPLIVQIRGRFTAAALSKKETKTTRKKTKKKPTPTTCELIVVVGTNSSTTRCLRAVACSSGSVSSFSQTWS